MFPNDTAPGRHLPTSDTRRQKWDKIHSSILLSVAWKAARSWECTFEDEEEADGAEDVDNEEEDVDADDEDEDVQEEDENVDEENEDDEVDEEVDDEHLDDEDVDVADDDDEEERWENLLRQESKGSLLEEEAASEEEQEEVGCIIMDGGEIWAAHMSNSKPHHNLHHQPSSHSAHLGV